MITMKTVLAGAFMLGFASVAGAGGTPLAIPKPDVEPASSKRGGDGNESHDVDYDNPYCRTSVTGGPL